MKKEILIITALTLLLVGCAPPGGSSGGSYRGGDDYHTGYNGISMRFIQGNPPTTLYASESGGSAQTENFKIMLEVQNDGAYDLTGGTLYKYILSGYDDTIVQLGSGPNEGRGHWYKTSTDDGGLLRGRSTDNPVGDFDTLTWNVDRIVLPDGTDSFSQRFMVSACYDYQTTASIAVCVDPKPWKATSREKVCTPGSASVSGGQGAPVAVTNVDVTPMNDKVQMKVTIQNSGNGRVLSTQGSAANCPHDLDYNDLDEVDVQVTLGQVSSGCREAKPNPVQLVNGRGFFYVTCDLGTTSGREDAYMTTLKVVLDYGYTQSVYQNMEIVAVPG